MGGGAGRGWAGAWGRGAAIAGRRAGGAPKALGPSAAARREGARCARGAEEEDGWRRAGGEARGGERREETGDLRPGLGAKRIHLINGLAPPSY